MLTYSLLQTNGKPIYEYLYECIKNDILSGILKSGDKLPSKRAFAKNNGISVITVENAYGQLMAEGYIQSRARAGYFVSDIHSQIQTEKAETDLIHTEKSAPRHIFADFISNRTLAANFPFSIWARLMRQVLAEEDTALMTAPPAGGVMELREAIAGHLRDFRGIHISPEQIIVGAGSEYLYGLLIPLFGRDRTYALEEPGYRKLQKIYETEGANVIHVPMDEQGIRLTDLRESHADIVQISPSHHFPTGIVMPVSRRYGLLEWASEAPERYIIEDDYDSEFRLQGKPIPSMLTIDVSDKVVYFNTFTKSLSSTIRISYMILPKPLLKRFYEKLGFYSCTVSNFEQYTLARFINEGYFEKHINRMRSIYRGIRDMLLNEFRSSPLADRITIREEHSGLHFLLTFDTSLSDRELKERALQNGIRISFLSDYFDTFLQASPYTTHTAVINYSGIEQQKIHEAVKKLAASWT